MNPKSEKFIALFLVFFLLLILGSLIAKESRGAEVIVQKTTYTTSKRRTQMTIQEDFAHWSKLWKSFASKIINPDSLSRILTTDKEREVKLVYENIKPICKEFINIVIGNCESRYLPEVTIAVCYNRLLKGEKINNLHEEQRELIIKLLQEAFYLGIFSQLYCFHFPTRELVEKVDINRLQESWEIDAIEPTTVMGYYGDPKNPILMDIWKYHFETEVSNVIKQQFNIGFFAMGKHRQFFKSLYIAGALLVMSHDLATKGKYKHNELK